MGHVGASKLIKKIMFKWGKALSYVGLVESNVFSVDSALFHYMGDV